MASKTPITKKATNVYQTGSTWKNVADIFDDNASSSYGYSRNITSASSAAHINKFDFSSIPDYAIIEKVEVYTKFATSSYGIASLNPKGYCAIYLYSDGGSIGYKIVANGEEKSAQYCLQTYTAATIQSKLASFGIHDGDVVKYLKEGLRIRIVGGGSSVASTSSAYSECRVYDNYVTVYYSVPDYTVSVIADSNGTVSGAGTYEHGTQATLIATPDDGYVFSHWSDGNTSATRTVTVTSAATYTAYFEKIPRYVTYDSIFNF